MCLNVKKNAQSKIAETNIVCYKSLEKNRSLLRNFKYSRFFVNKKVLIYMTPGLVRYSSNEINQGYHSRNSINRKTKSHLFIIPKGTEYFEGTENSENIDFIDGYVSSTIIYIGKNNRFNRFIGKLFYGVVFESEKEMLYFNNITL